MAYVKRQRQRNQDPNHEYLVGCLVKEFSKKMSQLALATESDPVIIEEQMRNSDRLQVYVIWAAWSDVQEEHRSAAILDAYERHFRQVYASRIVIALGLTPPEAKKLGIQE